MFLMEIRYKMVYLEVYFTLFIKTCNKLNSLQEHSLFSDLQNQMLTNVFCLMGDIKPQNSTAFKVNLQQRQVGQCLGVLLHSCEQACTLNGHLQQQRHYAAYSTFPFVVVKQGCQQLSTGTENVTNKWLYKLFDTEGHLEKKKQSVFQIRYMANNMLIGTDYLKGLHCRTILKVICNKEFVLMQNELSWLTAEASTGLMTCGGVM